MASRLVNVRLDEARVRKAQRLREGGVPLSGLVREAIDARFDRLARPLTPRRARDIVRRILAAYPDPAGLPRRSYDVHHRQSARQAIIRKLARRRR